MPEERKPVEGRPNEADGTFTKIFWFEKHHYPEGLNDEEFEKMQMETITACATELLVRWYLKCRKFKYVSELKCTDKDSWLKRNTGDNGAKISRDFVNTRDELAKNILEHVTSQPHIKITMELGRPVDLRNLAVHWKENKDQIYRRIKELFHLLTEAQSVGLVHVDLKISNLLCVTRYTEDGTPQEDVWVLNDMDSSIILSQEQAERTYRADKTPGYAPPEVLGANTDDYEKSNEKIGFHTDVFLASMIAYRMLNNGKFPTELSMFPEKARIEDFGRIKYLQEEKKEYGIPLPKYGKQWLIDIIMTGLTADETNRPDASDILEHLESETPYNRYHKAGAVKSEADPSEAEKRKRSRRTKNNILLIAAACLLFGVLAWKPLMQMLSAKQKPANGQAEAQTSAVVSETQPPAETKISTEPLITTVQTEDTAVTQTDAQEDAQKVTTAPGKEESSKNDGSKNGGSNSESGGGGKPQVIVVYPPDDDPTDKSNLQQETEESASEPESPFVWEEVSYDIRNSDTGDTEPLTGLEIRDCRDFAGGTLTIPSEIDGKPVIAIGNSAFEDLGNRITSLELPDSVVYIGDNAFANSFDGERLNLYYVRHIGARAFYNSGSLQKIELSPGLVHIGDYAFSEDAPSDEREIIYNMNSSKWRNLVDKGASPLGSEGLFNEPPLF